MNVFSFILVLAVATLVFRIEHIYLDGMHYGLRFGLNVTIFYLLFKGRDAYLARRLRIKQENENF